MSKPKKLSYAGDDFDDYEYKPTPSSLQDSRISDVTNDLPNFFVKEKKKPPIPPPTRPPPEDDDDNIYEDPNDMSTKTYDSVCSEDNDENLELLGGEPIGQDVHTLVRNTKTQLFTRDPTLRGSMVVMKEGVPGIFSGYDRKAKAYSKLERSGSESSVGSGSNPVPPPRNKSRNKSDSSMSKSQNYDKLWASKKGDGKTAEDGDHVYSMLGEGFDEREYDRAEDGNQVLSSSPVKDGDWSWRKHLQSPGISSTLRPASTVILPISPIEEASGSDSASDWGSEFEDVIGDCENEDDLYEVVGDMSQKIASNRDSVFESVAAVRARTEEALKTKPHMKGKPLPSLPKFPPLPPVPPRSKDSSLNEQDDDSLHYIDVGLDGKTLQSPLLPVLNSDATKDEVQRYQIIKYILENEKAYTVALHKLIQDYERPLKDKRIISQNSVKIIFQHLQEIEQCHHLFNIALSGRMSEWQKTPKIGDIIYASFSNSMVLKAYSSYVKNFTKAMEHVKETCKLVPAFLYFLKTRLNRSFSHQTFYDLLKRPLGRFPQLVVLLQELLKVTPISHSDRMPLQMALTQLECLSELICEKRRDMEMRYRVSLLDKYFTGLSKPLFSSRRYHIRHDNMLLCKVQDGQVVKTKVRRLFLLSDLLICASIINKSNAVNKLSKKRYRVKWCVPVAEVDIVDVGSGILVNIDNKTTTIKYTHPVSSPRPGAKKVEEELEALQHDLAVIGQIAGLVATLRKSHEVINEQKCNEWYREVKDTFDSETEMANMKWLELALPTKDKKTATYLFKLSKPQLKLEWTTELDNAKLRLSNDNNPGWYILEDETESSENMGILRRNLPLLCNKLPLFMIDSKYTIQCILEVTPPGCIKPILWILGGNDHTGQITLMEMSMSSIPHVIENFVACGARILAAEVVKEESSGFSDRLVEDTLVWCGTMSGSIHIYNASSENDHEEVAVARLRDAVLCFKHIQSKVFCGLANGTIACFRKKADASWDFENPTVVCLGKSAVMNVTEAGGRLWCACGNTIYIMDINTLGIEHKINTGDRPAVRHLVSYGSGVWASLWKTPKLNLYHNETYECLQSISVTTPLIRMRNDVDSQIQNINIEKAHITCLQARGGLLWVGTDVGLIVTYPLPRLGGIPQVSGRPCVSFHGHAGPVRCIHAFRVERNFRNRGVTEDFDARSLFYVDPFDEAASGLNIPAILEEAPAPTPSPSNEPFYFQVIPENTQKRTDPDSSSTYEDWLKSFGRHPKDIDPLLAHKIEDPIDSYNSDESMDSDTEFSFIEDKAKKIPAKTKKTALGFSVDIKPASDDGEAVGTVKAKNGTAKLPAIEESNFAALMQDFDGFSAKDQNDTSNNGSGFVMIEKTDSGYEQPIPAEGKATVKVPYAQVNKDKPKDEFGALQHSFSIDETVQPDVKEPDEKDLQKYRDEPLPNLPAKTLYQAAKEWVGNGDVNTEGSDVYEASVGKTGEGEDRKGEGIEQTSKEKDAINLDDNSSQLDAVPSLPEAGPSGPDNEYTSDTPNPEPKKSESTRRLSDDQNSLSGQIEASDNVPKPDTEAVSQIDTSTAQRAEIEDLKTVVDNDEISKDSSLEESPKAPLSIKLTDIENQSSIEGSLQEDGGYQVERKGSDLPNIGNIYEKRSSNPDDYQTYDLLENREPQSEAQIDKKTETLPNAQAATMPYAPHPKSHGAAAHSLPVNVPNTPLHHATPSTLPANVPQTPIDMQTPKNVDLSNIKDTESESVYTPLLNQTNESNTSSLYGIGTGQFDTEMALSSSLARDNQHGHYASLISVSNRDSHSRLELLMKPMYVVSVGNGYLDLRKKQKLGSGIDFFKNLTASEPEPKLLVWKITS